MKIFNINFTVLCIFLLALSGCDNKSTEATKLGFSSVQEMEEIHSKGWHTKAQYDNDAAKKLGFNSAAEMKVALEKQRVEKERIANEAILAEQKRKEMAAQCDYNLASVMYDYAFNRGRISGAVEAIGYHLAAAQTIERMELEKDKQLNERTIIQAAGIADYNGKQLPACIEKINLNLVNRSEGKRNTLCYMLGYIYDKEFGMYRKMKVAECKEFNIDEWKSSAGIISLN
jgi:hypothetical protein